MPALAVGLIAAAGVGTGAALSARRDRAATAPGPSGETVARRRTPTGDADTARRRGTTTGAAEAIGGPTPPDALDAASQAARAAQVARDRERRRGGAGGMTLLTGLPTPQTRTPPAVLRPRTLLGG
jgi:hypothetical protein